MQITFTDCVDQNGVTYNGAVSMKITAYTDWENLGYSLDLTGLEAWAIDDAGNQDPDDAVSLEGNRLWVHIADAAALILPDGEADLQYVLDVARSIVGGFSDIDQLIVTLVFDDPVGEFRDGHMILLGGNGLGQCGGRAGAVE